MKFLRDTDVGRGLARRCVETSIRATSRAVEILRLWAFGGETKTSHLWDFQPKTQTAVALADERPSTPSDIVNHRPDFE